MNNHWWGPANWDVQKLHIPRNIYFDMDDTLTRTTHYFVSETKKYLIEQGMDDLLVEFEKLHSAGKTRFDYPEELTNINKMIMRKGEYMSKVLPTPLFNYFFLIPGNQPRDTHFGVITHRGDSKKSKRNTTDWFAQFDMAATLGHIYCIHPKKNPSKLDYLMEIHPDGDFLLVDDNPLYDTTINHPHSPNLRIYDAYSKYNGCYSQQKHVVMKNGLFLL